MSDDGGFPSTARRVLEVKAGAGAIDLPDAGTNSYLGSGAVTINGGELKLTTTGASATTVIDATTLPRIINFGTAGGTLNLNGVDQQQHRRDECADAQWCGRGDDDAERRDWRREFVDGEQRKLRAVLFGATGAQTYTANNDLTGILVNTLTLNSTSTAAVAISGNSLAFRTDDTAEAIPQSGSGAVT